jgi:hypothetical protein
MKEKRLIKKKGKNKAAKPVKVLLPCDPKQEPISYQGRTAVGSIIPVEGKLAVVALAPEAGDHKLTEGYIFVPDDRMEPSRKKGDKLAICRKHPMQPFYWGYEYYTVDQRRESILCTIHPSLKQGSILLKFNNKKYRRRIPPTKSIQGFFLVEPLKGWPEDSWLE